MAVHGPTGARIKLNAGMLLRTPLRALAFHVPGIDRVSTCPWPGVTTSLFRGPLVMRRIVPALLTTCAWLCLLVLVAAGIARASIGAKERKASQDAHVAGPSNAP